MNVEKLTQQARTHPGRLGDPRRMVVPLATDADGSHRFPWHHHDRAQLIYAARGVLSVLTHQGTWVVPPHQAVWVPATIAHEVYSVGPLSMRSLYVHPDATAGLPASCCVVTVTALLRELILHACTVPANYPLQGTEQRLMTLIIDQLRELEAAPLYILRPQDSRARVVADTLLANPADRRSLQQWAREVGASSRTLARIFVRETNMTFGSWRRRLRLLETISRLNAGQAVTRVALDLGYSSPSAFVAMFKRTLGVSPGRYLRESRTGFE
ncbi:MAG: helix-turn-helix transcriptional regulator [Gammaproteobacteria bacterium]|nr:helix-turn-helix transcriptional regulator [Gammaproteobacteria bacterium]